MDTTSAFVPDLFSTRGAESPCDLVAAKGSRGINILPDIYFELSQCGPVSLDIPYSLSINEPWSFPEKDKYDLLVIPGGAKGAEAMSKHPSVQELVRRYIGRGKLVGMICAGTSIKLPIF